MALAGQGRLDEAAEILARALAADATRPESLNNLGRVRLLAGDRAAAADLFRRALALRPGYESARRNLADAER